MNAKVTAQRLHAQALVWDNHACPPRERAEDFLPAFARYRASGLTVQGVNIGDSNVPLDELVIQAAKVRRFVRQNPNEYLLIEGVDDIERARMTHRLGIFLNIEGCYALGEEISLLELFYDIGVRWMAMVYNRRNTVGSGVHDDEDEGLTVFGREAVAEMDRVGIIKCCSHTGYRTTMDVFEASTRPCIFSHSNPRALRDHPRNIPDHLIQACAATGGVVGINGVGIFLGDNDISTETMVRHIDYVAQLVGPQHIGIGLDTVLDEEGMNAALGEHQHIWPQGFGYAPGIRFVQPEQLPELTEALLARGYGEGEVRGILGENMLRVARAVWRP